jgi:phage FluMu gp28-like protein
LEVQLYHPHLNQQKIHNSINSEGYKYYVLNIGRQFGKSLLAQNQALYWGFNIPNAKIGWVSPIYRQAKKVYAEMCLAFAEHNVLKVNASDLELRFPNGSIMKFFSAERYDNIRGETFDYLIIDEFAFIDEAAWTEVLRATVLVKGKKVLLISTPKGKNHFFNLFQLDGVNTQYKSFRMTSYDNPIINPTEIDDARITLPDHVFRQEYLAEFVDGGYSLFDMAVFSDNTETTSRYYAGIDLGRADDYTVISVFNQKGQQVFIDRWRQDSWTNIVNKLVKVINKYQAYTLIEVNSIGDAIFEQVRNGCVNKSRIQPFVTTSKSKQDIIEQLVVATQNKEVQFSKNEWLKKELEIFGYEYNPKNKSVRYAAPSGFHDDAVMATAIAYEAYKNLKSAGKYALLNV